MRFEEILLRAKKGEQAAITQILNIFRPLLVRNSLVNGRFDEDLYQELIIETIKCIQYFKILK